MDEKCTNVVVFQTTSIEPFKSQYISDIVLKKLLTLEIYVEVKVKKDEEETRSQDFIIQVRPMCKSPQTIFVSLPFWEIAITPSIRGRSLFRSNLSYCFSLHPTRFFVPLPFWEAATTLSKVDESNNVEFKLLIFPC